MTPRSHAIAYRIWAYADPMGWNCTIREVADAIGVSASTVRGVSQWRNWLDRFRSDASADTYMAVHLSTSGMARDRITPADYHARAELDE